MLSSNLHKKGSKVSIETRSTPASLSFTGQVTNHTTVKWTIDHRTEILKADVSSVNPSSERIEELWVVCSFYSGVGATLLVVTWQREK